MTTAPFSPTHSQFALTDILTLTLAPGSVLSGFTGVSLMHAPEPGTLTLAFSGLIALGIGPWLRRRGRRAGEAIAPIRVRLALT
jgi:hypothetical protein